MAFTEKEAKSIGVKLSLLNEWEQLMNALWIPLYLLGAQNNSNEIHFNEFRIGAFFVNNNFIEVKILQGNGDQEIEFMTCRHINNLQTRAVVMEWLKNT